MASDSCSYLKDDGTYIPVYHCDYGCCNVWNDPCCHPFFTTPVIVGFVLGGAALCAIFCIFIGWFCRSVRRKIQQERLVEQQEPSVAPYYQNNFSIHERIQEEIFSTSTTMTYPATLNHTMVNEEWTNNYVIEYDDELDNFANEYPPTYEEVCEDNFGDTTRIVSA